MMIVSVHGLWSMDTSKLLAIILNRVFNLYNVKEYRKYFIERNLHIENLTKKYIIHYSNENRYNSNMYYHYYIYLTIVPDLLKEEIPDLLGE